MGAVPRDHAVDRREGFMSPQEIGRRSSILWKWKGFVLLGLVIGLVLLSRGVPVWAIIASLERWVQGLGIWGPIVYGLIYVVWQLAPKGPYKSARAEGPSIRSSQKSLCRYAVALNGFLANHTLTEESSDENDDPPGRVDGDPYVRPGVHRRFATQRATTARTGAVTQRPHAGAQPQDPGDPEHERSGFFGTIPHGPRAVRRAQVTAWSRRTRLVRVL